MKYLLFCFLYKIKPFPKPHCFQLVSTISLIHTSKMFVPFSSGKKINQKLSLQSSNFYLFCLFFPHFRNMSSNGVCLPVSTCTTDGTTGRVKQQSIQSETKMPDSTRKDNETSWEIHCGTWQRPNSPPPSMGWVSDDQFCFIGYLSVLGQRHNVTYHWGLDSRPCFFIFYFLF